MRNYERTESLLFSAMDMVMNDIHDLQIALLDDRGNLPKALALGNNVKRSIDCYHVILAEWTRRRSLGKAPAMPLDGAFPPAENLSDPSRSRPAARVPGRDASVATGLS